MKIYSQNEQYKLYSGSMLSLLEVIEPNSISSIVTDPPYELNFMGKGWDNSGIAFQKETWEKCFEVLKPGGFLLAFGGSRTFHRIAVAIEDAGFEIRDVIMWLYGSGFPKSMDLGKSVESKVLSGSANTTEFKKLAGEKTEAGNWGISGNTAEYGARPRDYSADGHLRTTKVDYQTEEGLRWDGWGTCLKPAYEPIIVARKPCEGSTTDNVLKYGVGGINIDECRVPTDDVLTHGGNLGINSGDIRTGKALGMFQEGTPNTFEQNPNGRFPANVILTYDETDEQEVCGGMPVGDKNGTVAKNYESTNVIYGKYNGVKPFASYGDNGSAARYFYCAKASKKDRDEGCDALPTQYVAMSNQSKAELKRGNTDFSGDTSSPLNALNKIQQAKNIHPTVKPTTLMQYLVRLVTPKGGTILDPFNGSGSTGKAVMYENIERRANYQYVGIELTEQYLPIAKARIEYAQTGVLAYSEGEHQIVHPQTNSKYHGLF